MCGRKRRFHSLIQSTIAEDMGRLRCERASLVAIMAGHESISDDFFFAIVASDPFSMGENYRERYMESPPLEERASRGWARA